jgi:hypothetical protein
MKNAALIAALELALQTGYGDLSLTIRVQGVRLTLVSALSGTVRAANSY